MPYFVRTARGILDRRRIAYGWTGADHVQIVANHVGKNQRDGGRGIGELRQLSSFERRQMLADRVDFMNGRAAGEQDFRSAPVSRPASWEGPAAGVSADAPPEMTAISRSRGPALARDFGHAAGAFHAALIGDGMAAILLMDSAQMGGVSVLDVDPAAGDAAAQEAFHRARHGGAGFARADHLNAVESGDGIFSRPAVITRPSKLR